MTTGSVKQYTYDEQNRLKRCITDLNYITDYWYDEYNNITVTRTLSGGAAYLVYYEYDENNRLISSNDGHTTTVYEYDCNGNMVKSSGEEDLNYIFNGAGELAEVWNKGEVYTYEYDYTGLRIAKTVNGVTTSMITDGMYVVAEYVGANSTYYYRGMNLMGYVSDDEIGYYRFNAHGDVVAVVDIAGGIVTEYSYDLFGKLEDDENEWLKILFGIYVEDENPFRYCAEYYDSETEFIYLRARYYSPDLQRFISEDPIRDGFNWYAYCGNMPIMFSDPSGYMSCGKYGNGGNDRVTKYPVEKTVEFFSGLFTKLADVFQEAKDAGIQWASKEFLERLKDTNSLYRSDNTLLAAKLRDSAIKKHYENNEKLQISGFIDNQLVGKAAEVQMGCPLFGSNACGWVAAYNAFKKLKNKVSPADIISFFESNDYLIADGAFGVNPLAFDHLFEVYGFSSSTVYFDANDLDAKAKAAKTAILAYAYVDIGEKSVGAHFINLTWNEEKEEYTVYNGNDNFTSIADFLESNDYIFISLTSINEREVYNV